MRLINIESLELQEFLDDSVPPYVAASHRWLSDEVTFQDVRDRRNTNSGGYHKVKAFTRYVRDNVPHIKWLWIDTCCINKESAAELSEAINSMFEWYRNTELCIAYLADVETTANRVSLEKSEWFKRGWTLQELLAPRKVLFVTSGWETIGYKGAVASGDCWATVGYNLEETIHRATDIPVQVLHDYGASATLSVEQKLKWMHGRITTRPEDMSYAMYGILGVTLGANYGERYEGARQRLLAATHQRDSIAVQQAEQYRKIMHWLSPPDPETNHESARQRHEPQTGLWLLQDTRYLDWMSGSTNLLWAYGMAGCGKTILCSTAIEDLRLHFRLAKNVGHAIFYFSFSDSHKQTLRNLMVSLVAQLCDKEPGLSLLRQAYENPQPSVPGLPDLERILNASVASYDTVFLHLDALDECPEGEDVRQKVLDGVQQILARAPNIRMFVTSRDVPDIRSRMEESGAIQLSIATQTVDADIGRYVSRQLSRDPKLRRLDHATRTLIKDTLSNKSNGMFRWVFCQLQELKKSKSTRPRSVRAALLALPQTLDETYERMLTSISESDRPYAFTFLRWLTYAKSPLSLNELAEASIIEPAEDPLADDVVDIANRGVWGDVLEILAGLVTTEGADREEQISGSAESDAADDSQDIELLKSDNRVGPDTIVRLAHFSVKEYLESPRLRSSDASGFALVPATDHRSLTQSCLAYLEFYSQSPKKTLTSQDLEQFPLLEYVASFWYDHALQQESGSNAREMNLLTSDASLYDWLRVHDPNRDWKESFQIMPGDVERPETALYYSTLLGLEPLIREILSTGADVNAHNGSAMYAAAVQGHGNILRILVQGGAEVNVLGPGDGFNALFAASMSGSIDALQVLVDAGADVNHGAWDYKNLLYLAAAENNSGLIRTFVKGGADVNAASGERGNAIQVASMMGYEDTVRILVEGGADVNNYEGYYGSALYLASAQGHKKVVRMLLDAGADVNAEAGQHGSALQAALKRDCIDVALVRMLIDAGADVKAREAHHDGNGSEFEHLEDRTGEAAPIQVIAGGV